MNDRSTEALIDRLARDARPIRPLAPPMARAAGLLGAIALVGMLLVTKWGDVPGLAARYSGQAWMMIAENGAMLATAILAVCGAFALSVPGGSRRWLLAPLLPLLLWVGASGVGCYESLKRLGDAGWGWGTHGHCLLFILGAGAIAGTPLLWLLSRARPIDPVPVALLGGLGAAALAALLLQFFHPFPVTVVDLGLHLLAVLILVGAAALFRRPALRPA